MNENDVQSIEPSATITLGLLEAVHEDAQITQRSAAKRLGIALGLTNAYLKRCVKKGLIKIQQVPRKRYAYYLTPQGFAEKSRLTAEYLSSSLGFFRRARLQLGKQFADCEHRGWRRVVLVGISDLAEIASLCARDHGVEIAAIVDERTSTTRFVGLAVVRSFSDVHGTDAVVVTALDDIQTIYDRLRLHVADERILVPKMLGTIKRAPGGE